MTITRRHRAGWLLPAMLLMAAPVAGARADAGQASAPTPRNVTHQLRRHQAEVRQLQDEVRQQEQRSAQARERQRRQDQAIADLRRQLRELQAGAGQGGG